MSRPLTFEEACELVRGRSTSVPVSDSDKRLMYVCYKVATVGPHPVGTAPSRASPKYRYWRAWEDLGPRLTPEAARERYIDLVVRVTTALE